MVFLINYFIDYQRIYVDEYDYEMPPAKLPRSNSFPDLRALVLGGLSPPTPPHPRRRANSEVVPIVIILFSFSSHSPHSGLYRFNLDSNRKKLFISERENYLS